MQLNWDYISVRMTEDAAVTLNHISATKTYRKWRRTSLESQSLFSKECTFRTLVFTLLMVDSNNKEITKQKDPCYQSLVLVGMQCSILHLNCINTGWGGGCEMKRNEIDLP